MSKEKNVTFEEVVETKEVETQIAPVFSLEENDYKRIIEIINAATQKGAFTGDEIYITGLTYERVKKHVTDNYPSN